MPEVLETSCPSSSQPHPDYPSGQLYYVGISTHVVDLRNPILSDPILTSSIPFIQAGNAIT